MSESVGGGIGCYEALLEQIDGALKVVDDLPPSLREADFSATIAISPVPTLELRGRPPGNDQRPCTTMRRAPMLDTMSGVPWQTYSNEVIPLCRLGE